MNLYFLENYNNYFNRTIKPLKQYQTIEDFEFSEMFTGNAMYITGVNFNFADYIDTTQILNWSESWMPDYMILVDDNGGINSTWFVIDAKYQRNGQLNISLRRDLINDYYDQILDAPMYIEKATINDTTNPLLYNSEGVVFNQIKTSETQLWDETGCGWVVGYVAKPSEGETDVTIEAPIYNEFDYTLASFPLKDYIDQAIPVVTNYKVYVYLKNKESWRHSVLLNYDEGFKNYNASLSNHHPYPPFYNIGKNKVDVTKFGQGFHNNIGYLKNVFKPITTTTDLASYNNKRIYDSATDKFYRVKVTELYGGIEKSEIYWALGGNLSVNTDATKVAFEACANAALSNINYSENMNGALGEIVTTTSTYTINLIPIPQNTISTKIVAGRTPTIDAVYDIFAIPYGQLKVTMDGNTVAGITNPDAAVLLAHNIAEKLGSKLYDIQLLPYCPRIECYDSSLGMLSLLGFTEGIDYSLCTSGAENAGLQIENIIIWAKSNKSDFTIPYSIIVKDHKIENECDTWRLCSPNWQGMFDFSAAKNQGVDYFTVNYTYKPYNPYIHVAPNWKGLYGTNYNDARGLICGGDYSLPSVSDAFTQYEINNKNYQNIFDRGIQNLEYNRKFQRANEIASAITGSVGTSTVGFMAGGAAGAVVGGVLGLGAGIADAAIAEAQYKENLNYKTDLYNYNLGNIKAIPDSLTKTSAFNNNNKIVPVLEYYTCTDAEKTALKNKIKYNGMTVMAIGQLKDYLLPEETFVQGQLIRIDAVDDAHTANAIYNELKKGVFTAYTNSEA